MRRISVVITMILASLVIYGFFRLVIPEIVKSVQSIAVQFPTYVNNLYHWTNNFLSDNPDIKQYSQSVV